MDEVLLFRGVRPSWIEQCVQILTTSIGSVNERDVRDQIELFADLLEHAVTTGESSWMDSLLSDWAAALTVSDLEERQPNLCILIQKLSQTIYQVCYQNLPVQHSQALIGALIPCFNYSFVKAAEFEIMARIQYAAEQISQMKLKMESLDKSKSDFISVASHELRTPLTLIEGYAAILRENLERAHGNTADKSQENGNSMLLDGIHNGARRLRGIVDDMVDVSMIDNNMLNLNFQPVWINRLFVALRNEMREGLKERNQTLEIEDFPGSNDMTFGDPERLLQVFRNLLTNAIKYTPDNKSIQVRGRRLPGFIEILVHDNGIGIPPEDISRIFEKFIRLGDTALHSTSKVKFKGGGPGLGLHIAKGIVEAHGGAIWAESPGFDETSCPGATFHVLLPVRDQPPDIQVEKWLSNKSSPTIPGKEFD